MAENTYKGFLDNTGLEYLLNNILAHKKNIKTLTINDSKYDPLGANNTNITIDAASLGLESGLHFIGKQDTLPNSANNGDIVLVGNKEYIYSNGAWIELGDEGSYALKTIKINTGAGLTGGGTLANDITISHADTSNVENIAAADRTYIKSLTFDGFGHVTGVTTGTETMHTLPVASNDTLGGVKIGNGIDINNGTISIKTNYTTDTNNKNYKVQTDANGNLFVNVPWEKGSSDITGTVQISQGGTGATDRANASANILYLGNNVINSITNDTISNWSSLGFGMSFYSTGGLLNNQPTQYGHLINVINGVGGDEIFQLWHTAPTGAIYHRGGNGNGWGGTWTKIYDTNNKPSAADIGAAPAVHSHANIVNGTVNFFAGISQTPLLTAQQNDKNVWAIERSGAAYKSLTAHYYDGSGTWEGSGVLLDSGNYTAYITPAAIGAVAASSLAKVATSGNYNDLSNKPATFAPSTHTHPISEINNIIIATSKPTTVTNGALLFVYSN